MPESDESGTDTAEESLPESDENGDDAANEDDAAEESLSGADGRQDDSISRVIRWEDRETEDEEDTGDEYVTHKQIFSHGTIIIIELEPAGPKPKYASRLLSKPHRQLMREGPGAFGFILAEQVMEQETSRETDRENSDQKDSEELEELEELENQEEQEDLEEELRRQQEDLEAEQRQAEEEGEWRLFGPGF